MEISLVPPSFPLTSVRYRNRPILSCSTFPRGEIELDCPVEDSLTTTVNNTMDEKMDRTSVTIAAAMKISCLSDTGRSGNGRRYQRQKTASAFGRVSSGQLRWE